MLEDFLSAADAERASRTLRKLLRHNISTWALAGGFATEIHRLRAGCAPSIRGLNDIDFIAGAFDCVPATLARDFLFRHVHPLDPPGKTLLQFVDAETAVRVDLFRAYDAAMSRTVFADLPFGRVPLISLEDAVARAARLVLDLGEGVPVLSKHADNYLRLAELVEPKRVEGAWQDHRKLRQPAIFREADALARNLILEHGDLLIHAEYSKDTAAICARCVPDASFPLADAEVVLALLGYC